MTVRQLSSLAAAALLTCFAAPALAQDRPYDPGEPPPLPPLEEEWRDWDFEPDYGENLGHPIDGTKEAPGVAQLEPHRSDGAAGRTYAPEQRAAWIDDCARPFGTDHRGREDCEAYLTAYERAYRNPGPGVDYAGGPVMWVKVPIVRERRHDCRCEKGASAAGETRAIVERRAPRTKIRRIAPAK